jgi:hypothetical protein
MFTDQVLPLLLLPLLHPICALLADAVPADCPRLLINMTKVGEKQQQQEQQEQQQQRHKVRHTSSCSSDSSSSYSSDADDAGSCSGFESDATALTASSSCANISCDEASAAAAADDAASGSSSASADTSSSAAAAAVAAAAAGGFDFSSGRRDVLSLGDCDGGVMQLAELLGWQRELQQLVQQGREAFEEAKREWEDA